MKINIIFLSLFISLCLTSLSAKSTLYPSETDSVGRLLCNSINLDYPGLEQVKTEANKGNYSAALEAWRDYKVMFFRNNKSGLLRSHANLTNRTASLPYANYVIGNITTEQFLASTACTFRDEFQLYGFNAPLNSPSNINWLAKKSDGTYPGQFANFFLLNPLVANYYLTGEDINLKKYFQIVSDFACRQKLMYQNSIAKGIDVKLNYNCDWSTKAQQALSEADRVNSIIKSIAILCKTIQQSDRLIPWATINMPKWRIYLN